MTWVAVAVAGSAVVAGGASAYSARQGANASQRGTDQATAEQGRQFDLVRSDTARLRGLGNAATDRISQLYGYVPPGGSIAASAAQDPVLVGDTNLPAGTTTRSVGNGYYEVTLNGQRYGTLTPGGPNGRFINDTGIDPNSLVTQPAGASGTTAAGGTGQPDMSVFFNSPDYEFNLSEGQRAIDRSLAARGGALSGASVREGARYASGMASREYSAFYDRLAQQAGLGVTGIGASAQAGANMANNNSAAYINNANARASAYNQTAQGVNSAVQGGTQNFLLSRYLQGGG